MMLVTETTKAIVNAGLKEAMPEVPKEEVIRLKMYLQTWAMKTSRQKILIELMKVIVEIVVGLIEVEVTLDKIHPGYILIETMINSMFSNQLFFSLQGKPRGQLALSASETVQNTNNSNPSKKQSSTASMSSSSSRKPKTELNLRDRLTQQLVSGQAECMVCLEKIKPKNATWHCDGECYQVFHIHCIKKWSKIARTDDGGWR